MKEYCSNMKEFKPEISLVLFLWNELEALLLLATWTYPAFLLWQFCRCKQGQLWLFFTASEVKMPAKCCCLRSWQLATESACLHWRRGSQREPVWLARCCPGPPRPIQVVRSSFKKSEPLCSSSIIPQVRWRPSSLDKMLEVSDSFWLWNIFLHPHIFSPSSIKSFYLL